MTKRQQYLPSIQRVGNFVAVGNSILLPCTTTSGSDEVAFPALATDSPATDVLIYNAGSVAAWIAFGNDSSVVVAIPTAGTPANGIALAPGVEMALDKSNALYVVGITASSTASVYITQGIGS